MRALRPWAAGLVLLAVARPAHAATIIVPAGADIQAAVDANPPGTTYRLSAGTFRGQTIRPKSGDTFLGAPGRATVLDGGGGRAEHHAFLPAPGTNNVTVSGLVIQRYVDAASPDLETGVFGSRGPATPGWRIEKSDIRFNAGAGVVTGSGMTVFDNRLHGNTLEGIKGYIGTKDVTIDNNDIYNNNLARRSPYGPTGFASAIKAVRVSNYRFTANRIHDNHGFGIWLDTDWQGIVIDSNEIYRQLPVGGPSAGIYMETGLAGASAAANRIARNFIHDNDIGLDIATASNLDVTANAFQDNRIATIRSFEEPRGAGADGVTLQERRVHVHHNWLAYGTGVVSQSDSRSEFIWYDQDNTYGHNTYFISCGGSDFAYQGARYGMENGTLLSYKAWMSLPSNPDATSTFHCGETVLPAGLAARGAYRPTDVSRR